jgi:hypothetical protein
MNLSHSNGAANKHPATVMSGDTAASDYDATYDALWGVIGDLWFRGRRRRVIEERGRRQRLSVEQVTPYSLQVHYTGAEMAEAAWSIELTREGADGWGGYEVCSVTSQTGDTVDELNERLLAACRLPCTGARRYWEG